MASSTPPALDGHPWARLLDVLDRGWRAVGLGVLWGLVSLPLVTAGPATAALFGVVRDDQLGRSRPVMRAFFHSFRGSWRSGLVLGALVGLPLLGRLAWRVSGGTDLALLDSSVWLIITVGVTIGALLASYAFPLAAHLDGPLSALLRTTVLFLFGRPGVTVCHLFLVMVSGWLVDRYPLSLPLIMVVLALVLTHSVHRMLAREGVRS